MPHAAAIGGPATAAAPSVVAGLCSERAEVSVKTRAAVAEHSRPEHCCPARCSHLAAADAAEPGCWHAVATRSTAAALHASPLRAIGGGGGAAAMAAAAQCVSLAASWACLRHPLVASAHLVGSPARPGRAAAAVGCAPSLLAGFGSAVALPALDRWGLHNDLAVSLVEAKSSNQTAGCFLLWPPSPASSAKPNSEFPSLLRGVWEGQCSARRTRQRLPVAAPQAADPAANWCSFLSLSSETAIAAVRRAW